MVPVLTYVNAAWTDIKLYGLRCSYLARTQRYQSGECQNISETMLNRILDARPKRERLAGTERPGSDVDLSSYSEEDLLYMLCGVPDGKIIRESLRREAGSI